MRTSDPCPYPLVDKMIDNRLVHENNDFLTEQTTQHHFPSHHHHHPHPHPWLDVYRTNVPKPICHLIRPFHWVDGNNNGRNHGMVWFRVVVRFPIENRCRWFHRFGWSFWGVGGDGGGCHRSNGRVEAVESVRVLLDL